MLDRQVKELVEFFTIKSVRDGELQGRTSGSLAWRLLRGEIKQENEWEVRKESIKVMTYTPWGGGGTYTSPSYKKPLCEVSAGATLRLHSYRFAESPHPKTKLLDHFTPEARHSVFSNLGLISSDLQPNMQTHLTDKLLMYYITAFPNTENRVENTSPSGVFFTNLEIFGNVVFSTKPNTKKKI